jgi:hypothetical protein
MPGRNVLVGVAVTVGVGVCVLVGVALGVYLMHFLFGVFVGLRQL